MNITKHCVKVAVITLTLSVGGASVAMAGDGDDGGASADRDARIAKVCENPDQAIAKLSERQTHLNGRLARLTEMRTKASDAGRMKLVKKLDRRLERLHNVLDRVTDRLASAPAWIEAHCS